MDDHERDVNDRPPGGWSVCPVERLGAANPHGRTTSFAGLISRIVRAE
jgi:hypothetical protein